MAKQDEQIKKEIIELLETELTISVVCARKNISRNSMYRWMTEDKIFAKQVDQAKRNCVKYLNDICEDKVVAKIRNDDSGMIKFWLRYRHPDYKQSYVITK